MPRNNARPVGRNQNNNYVENKTVLAVFSLIGFFLLLATCSSNNNPTDSAANNPTPPVSKGLMNTAPEETLRVKCRVVGVSDGDTFTCLTSAKKQLKIRMNQIDAPEKKQAFGTASKNALSSYIFGKTVMLKTSGKDKYGRTIAEVYLNNKNINKAMVADGYAWAYREYLKDQDYLSIEEQARSHSIGIWSQPSPIYPSDFRHNKANTPAVTQSQPIQKQPRNEVSVAPAPVRRQSTGRCGTKRYCREMVDCAEANFYLEKCGVSRLDGDSDGVPCESICN